MRNKRVVVAMSGGVDSSLVAAMLVEQGYEVIGVTMQLSDDNRDFDDGRSCCSLSSVDDARRVAAILGIPHYVINFKGLFREKVIDYFVQEYIKGMTPNPCIACNRYIKFDGLLKKAAELGATYVATGHYAIVEYDESSNIYRLRKGADVSKDQSYVLYHLNQDTLRHFLFPLGNMNKTSTREMAAKYKLPVAHKPDSQEICFVPRDDYKAFIKKQTGKLFNKGSIVNIAGDKIGEHQGIPFYTVGQRKGLGIVAPRPLYVLDIDVNANRLIVGEDEQVYARGLIAEDISWINQNDIFTKPMSVQAKIRYGKNAAQAVIYPTGKDGLKVIFEEKQRAITPGQSIVFYDGDYVLGGGIIVRNEAC